MNDPHAGRPVASLGPPLGTGSGVVIMLHGRGACAENILELVPVLDRPQFTYLAPSAAGNTWYPYSFMSAIERNEPHLSSALGRIDALVNEVAGRGVPKARVVLLGFSQGACLAGEYACRHGDRYGAVVMWSGGLIGPPGTTWTNPGGFDGTPVFLGCSDVDPHIPAWRVDESADVLREMGGDVTAVLYPGMDHTVTDAEAREVRRLIEPLGRRGGVG
jgi:phospholipase/carboxylesterase